MKGWSSDKGGNHIPPKPIKQKSTGVHSSVEPKGTIIHKFLKRKNDSMNYNKPSDVYLLPSLSPGQIWRDASYHARLRDLNEVEPNRDNRELAVSNDLYSLPRKTILKLQEKMYPKKFMKRNDSWEKSAPIRDELGNALPYTSSEKCSFCGKECANGQLADHITIVHNKRGRNPEFYGGSIPSHILNHPDW